MSLTDNWCTPKWLTELLGCFDLDPCSNKHSTVLAHDCCSLDDERETHRDGLAFDWSTRSVFVNPPYSNPLPWAQKLANHAGPWCALVKLDPSTRWWAALMEADPVVAPFRKRIRFEMPGDSRGMTANFPSVLVYSAWKPSAELAAHLWLPTMRRAA